MTEQTPAPLSLADFERRQWQQVLGQGEQETYFHYAEAFGRKYAEAKAAGDATAVAVFGLLRDITFFQFVPKSPSQPFQAALVMGGRRSAVPDDIGEDNLELLRNLAPSIADAQLKARVADTVWLRKRDLRSAQLAIDAYLESARRWENVALQQETGHKVSILYCVEQLERAIRLAKTIEDSQRYKAATDYAQALVLKLAPELVPLSVHLMDLLIEFHVGDPLKWASLANDAAERAESQNGHDTAREFRIRQAEYLRLASDDSGRRKALIAAAETYVHKADLLEGGSPPNYMLVADCLVRAIEAHRRISGQKARVDKLHIRLLDAQSRSVPQMGRISTPAIDIRPIVERSILEVKGKGLNEALIALAQLCASPSFKDLREQVQRQAKDAPLVHILPAVMTDASGKVVSRKPSLATDDPVQIEEGIRWWMVRELEIHRALTSQGIINPARLQILREHQVSVDNWRPLVSDNPLIPPGREMLFAQGLHAGLTGDLPAAAHFLIPQLENSFRCALASRGVAASKLDKDGVQRELYLQEILRMQEFKVLFSENLAFDLETLLVEHAGPNLRHRLAHGMIDHDSFYSAEVLYLWGLVLRVVALPALLRGAPNLDQSVYEHDYSAWAEGQARAVRAELLNELDADNLAEEIEDLGKSERRALTSQISNILAHLLKLARWNWLREQNERPWRAEITAFRGAARRLLRDNPGLKSSAAKILADAWEEATADVAKDAAKFAVSDERFEETASLGTNAYPQASPWTLEQTLDDSFWPSAGEQS